MNLFKWLLPKEKNVVFCRDCKHLIERGDRPELWGCAKAACYVIRSADLASGMRDSSNPYLQTAASERLYEDRCGPDAKHFEPKETA